MKTQTVPFVLFVLLVGGGVYRNLSASYQGKPFKDATHSGGPQVIPGRLQAALYDMGGEGIAYHDVDAINHGSGELNYKPEHCEEGVSLRYATFVKMRAWIFPMSRKWPT